MSLPAIISLLTVCVGTGALLVGALLFLVEAFKKHILWGLGCLFLPFVSLIFLCIHWPVGKRSFFVQLAGAAVTFVGIWGLVFFRDGIPFK